MTKVPFTQAAFEDLPEQPRIPHVYDQAEALTIRLTSDDFGLVNVHLRKFGSGPPLLLVHGLMTTSYSWRYAMQALGSHYTCFAPDLLGSGRSDKPLGASYAPDRLALWLRELQRELGIYGCKTIGNSMGGYLCLHLALIDPAAMSRLVVLHAPGMPEFRLNAARYVFALPGTSRLFLWLVRRDPLRWAHKNIHYYDESLKSLEEAREYGEPLRSLEGASAFLKSLRETMGIESIHSFVELLEERSSSDFPVPTLLLYARHDPMVSPSTGRHLARLIPSAKLEWLEQASHFAHVDAVDQFATRALSFLSERSR